MSPEALVRAWVESWSRGDFEAGKALLAEDASYGITAPGAGTSRDAFDHDSRAWKTAFPDGKGTITNVIASGDKSAAEVEWSGTNTGNMAGMPPTGKAVKAAAAVFVTARDGKIVQLMHHLDLAGILTQLGVMQQ